MVSNGKRAMKLISLNTWGGKLYKPLINFIKQESQDTDVFCFQEVFTTPTKNYEYVGYRLNLYQEISRALKDFKKDFKGYYASTQAYYAFSSRVPVPVDFDLSWGLTTFVREALTVKSFGDFFVFGQRNSFSGEDLSSLPRNLQYLSLNINNRKIIVCNFHGLWIPNSKGDTPSRIKQSEKIIQFLNEQNEEKILCGDFNLSLNTKSIEILEKDMRNLIKEYNIQTTRNKFYPGEDKYADYTFISKGIKVQSFKVPKLEISDHLPMILEFS